MKLADITNESFRNSEPEGDSKPSFGRSAHPTRNTVNTQSEIQMEIARLKGAMQKHPSHNPDVEARQQAKIAELEKLIAV
jgi:hypothetical protein